MSGRRKIFRTYKDSQASPTDARNGRAPGGVGAEMGLPALSQAPPGRRRNMARAAPNRGRRRSSRPPRHQRPRKTRQALHNVENNRPPGAPQLCGLYQNARTGHGPATRAGTANKAGTRQNLDIHPTRDAIDPAAGPKK